MFDFSTGAKPSVWIHKGLGCGGSTAGFQIEHCNEVISLWRNFQVTGRNIWIFALIDSEPRMQTKPVVFYLFMTYAIIEIFRYFVNTLLWRKCFIGYFSLKVSLLLAQYLWPILGFAHMDEVTKSISLKRNQILFPGTLSGSPSTLWVSSARVSLLWGTFLILRKLTGLFHLLITDTKNIHATIIGFQYFFQTSGMWASISQMWSGSISSLASFQCSTHRCGTCTSSGNIAYSYSYTIFHFSTFDFLHL